MPSPREVRNALRRRQRLLDNEVYGPKLVRLKVGERRVIDDLILQNRMREVRQLILDLDRARRQGDNVLRRAIAYASQPVRYRRGGYQPVDEEGAFWRLYEGIVE